MKEQRITDLETMISKLLAANGGQICLFCSTCSVDGGKHEANCLHVEARQLLDEKKTCGNCGLSGEEKGRSEDFVLCYAFDRHCHVFADACETWYK